MKEFKPKTRLQIYKEANFGSIQNIPDKYFIEETEALIDNKELTFNQDLLTVNYIAALCDSSIVLDSQDVVKIDNVVVPYYDNSATYQTGDLYWMIMHNPKQGNEYTGAMIVHNPKQENEYTGASITSVGASPSGTKHASTFRTIKKCALLPKTPIETYFADSSDLFNQEDFEILEPKTINEKLTVLECGGSGEFDISPKTRSQWYRAKALELVEELPSKVEQVALAEDVTVTWTASTTPGKYYYYCDIYEQEEEFSGSENITVTLNGDAIPQEEGPVYWDFKNATKIRVYYDGESEPVGNFVASAYLAKEELLIPPKTNIEKYYAYKAGLYEGELPDPKTADEYYIALECGWMPDEESVADPVGPINPGMNEGAPTA